MNNFYSATLGRVLKDWHQRRNITMYAIAKELKVNRQPLDDLENGKSSAPEYALRFLFWTAKKDPNIWQSFADAIEAGHSVEEQNRILEYMEQEQRNKDKAEAARKAKESEAAKAAVREEVKAEIVAEMGKAIEEVKTALAETQQAAATAAEAANQRAAELESAVAAANERAKAASDDAKTLREENNKLIEQAASMRKASLWKRILGKF